MATAVMCDNAVTLACEEEHLVFPIVGVEGPAMGEGDYLAGWVAPVLVVDIGPVFKREDGHVVNDGNVALLW